MAKKVKGAIDPSVVGTKVGALMTPEQIAASGTEHAHQCAFFQWVAIEGRKLFGADADLIFAVPNGGDRQAHVGAAMRAEGVKPGVPDVCWPLVRSNEVDVLYERITFPGLYVELKTPGRETTKNGGCSEVQVEWHNRLVIGRYAVAVAYGWQAMAWVAWLYYRNELQMPQGGKLIATPMASPPVVTENTA